MDNSPARGTGFSFRADHITINGGQFTDVGRDLEQRSLSTGAVSGSDLLLHYASTNAMHNSGVRSRCHPNTRIRVIDEVMIWITDLQRSCNVTWLIGPAGAGKSTIAQTIAERCDDQNLLAASYFFSDSKSQHNSARRFVTTIAYQLMKYIPDTTTYTDIVLKLCEAPLEAQWHTLIRQASRWIPESRPLVIIIDGVDQCESTAHDSLLELISRWVSEDSNIPFCFLIVSRPDPRITLRKRCQHIVLDESYSPGVDIHLFLKDRFGDIYRRHRYTMPSVALPWPTKETIERLVTEASGLFIYASLVTKFVDSPSHRPSDRLECIVNDSGSSVTAFAELDRLYTSLLSKCPDRELLLQILAIILFAGGRERPWTTLFSPDSPSRIDEFLEFRAGETFRVLHELRSLIHIPEGEDDTVIHILHPELRRFLLDPQRSKEFFIDADARHAQITLHCLRVVRQGLTQSPVRLSRVVEFSCFEWCFQCVQCGNYADSLDELYQFDLAQWLDWAVTKSVVLTRSSIAADPVLQYNKVLDWIQSTDYSPGQYTLNSLHEAYRRFLQNHCAGNRAAVVRLLGASQIIDGSSTRLVNTVTPAKKAWPVILCLLNAISTSEPLTVDFPLCRIHPAGFRQLALQTFLYNPILSGDFYVDLGAHQEYMTLCCLAVLQQGEGKSEASYCEATQYARMHWAGHLSNSPPSSVLLDCLSNLSLEYHDHEGHAGNVLAWLKKISSNHSELVSHWENNVCGPVRI